MKDKFQILFLPCRRGGFPDGESIEQGSALLVEPDIHRL